MDTSAVTVRNNPGRQRYELLDGETVIGSAHWVPFEGPGGPQRIFYHTTVDDAYSGQGLASRLAREALDDTGPPVSQKQALEDAQALIDRKRRTQL